MQKSRAPRYDSFIICFLFILLIVNYSISRQNHHQDDKKCQHRPPRHTATTTTTMSIITTNTKKMTRRMGRTGRTMMMRGMRRVETRLEPAWYVFFSLLIFIILLTIALPCLLPSSLPFVKGSRLETRLSQALVCSFFLYYCFIYY